MALSTATGVAGLIVAKRHDDRIAATVASSTSTASRTEAPPSTSAKTPAASLDTNTDTLTRTPAGAPPAPPATKPAVAMGSLSVNASPWATVRVNGKLAGTTPILRFPVRAGRASVTIENPKLGRKQVEVKIEPKKDTPLIVDLHAAAESR